VALSRLNLALEEASSPGRLVDRDRRFVWKSLNLDQHLDSLLWAVARASSELAALERTFAAAHVRSR
jgi:hypothetical protein